MVQQNNSQALVGRIFKIEKSLQHTNPKNNIVQVAASCSNQSAILEPEPVRDHNKSH